MKERYEYLDVLRGLTLVSMILYHASWDMVNLAGADWKWFYGKGAYIWQQSICWMFILLSGFCSGIGNRSVGRKLKRGLLVFGGGALVSAVTFWILPDDRVIFGVLTFLGSCMLLMIPLKRLFARIPAEAGLAGSLLLFVLFRDVNAGYLGFEGIRPVKLPDLLYQRGWFMTYLGFMQRDFRSTDYFSLLPWSFLFLTGYFLYRAMQKRKLPDRIGQKYRELPGACGVPLRFLAFSGRHSLLIYLLHQPVLYLMTNVFF